MSLCVSQYFDGKEAYIVCENGTLRFVGFLISLSLSYKVVPCGLIGQGVMSWLPQRGMFSTKSKALPLTFEHER